ncbi:MAG: LON peptidase substrate-binding domain-containing protein, partial [Pseudomonadota bacterium]
VIPIFPLSEALLLPRGRLPLNIFEPRYLAMFDDALKTSHRLIGMIQPDDKQADRGVAAEIGLRRVGCAGRIVSFSETEDGRYLIVLAGISRFAPLEEVEGFCPYRRVKPDWSPWRRDLTAKEVDEGFDRTRFLGLLKRYFEASGLSTDWDSLKDADEETLVNSLAMLCPFSGEEKQALLEAEMLGDRRASLVALMEFAVASHGEEGPLQ